MNRNPLMDLTSSQLQTLQNVIVERIQEETKKPDADFSMVAEWAVIADAIDTQRRHVWHEEKFGAYESIVDDILTGEGFIHSDVLEEDETYRTFSSDDIPF